jgi:hypothetical protein
MNFWGGVLLPDGRLLLTATTTLLWTYNPTTNDITLAAAGSVAFSNGVLLPDGRVFLVPSGNAATGFFDPATNSLTPGVNPGAGGGFRSCFLLSDGRVVMTRNGVIAAGASVVWIFNPANNSYTSGPSLDVDMVNNWYYSQILPDERILIVPASPSSDARLLIYDPFSNSYLNGPLIGQDGTNILYWNSTVALALTSAAPAAMAMIMA